MKCSNNKGLMTEMYRLYYYPGLASMAPHMILRELGLPHELVLVDRSLKAHKTPEYLRINPNGRIPTLVDGETSLFESAAICLHICEKEQGTPFIPAAGGPERSFFWQWLIFLTNTLQENLWHYYRPEFYVPAEDHRRYKDTMEQRILANLDVLDRALERRTALVGDSLTIPDFYLFMLCHWSRVLTRTPATFTNLSRHAASIAARPAVQEVIRIEALPSPLF